MNLKNILSGKKPATKEMLYDCIYMKCAEQINPSRWKVE